MDLYLMQCKNVTWVFKIDHELAAYVLPADVLSADGQPAQSKVGIISA